MTSNLTNLYKTLGGGNGGSLTEKPIASATSGGGLVLTDPLKYHSSLLALGKGFTGGNYYYETFAPQINTISKDDNSLIAHYKFAGTDESTIGNDTSGNDNHLVLKNNLNTVKNSPSRGEVIAGKYDNGFKFDGNEYFQYDQSSGLKFGLKTMSYSLWFNPNGAITLSQGAAIISVRKWNVAGWSHFYQDTINDNIVIKNSSGMHYVYSTPFKYWHTNDFNHFCYVFSEDGENATIKYYLNNTLMTTYTGDYTEATTSQYLQIGAVDDTFFGQVSANMIISDIRIYDKALTAEQVNLLYTTNDHIAPLINYAGGGGGAASSEQMLML